MVSGTMRGDPAPWTHLTRPNNPISPTIQNALVLLISISLSPSPPSKSLLKLMDVLNMWYSNWVYKQGRGGERTAHDPMGVFQIFRKQTNTMVQRILTWYEYEMIWDSMRQRYVINCYDTGHKCYIYVEAV